MKDNIILIGMPGAGKSTVGVQLAKHLAYEFVDTDLLIQTQEGKPLQDILDQQGCKTLRQIEADILCQLALTKTVIATGGSAVYSDNAMNHLKSLGVVVYLQISSDTVLKRINNEGTRGIARTQGQTLLDVFNERVPLYEQYADIVINNESFIDIDILSDKIDNKQTAGSPQLTTKQ